MADHGNAVAAAVHVGLHEPHAKISSASTPERFIARMARSKPVVIPALIGVGGLAVVAAIVVTALSRPIEGETGTGRAARDDAMPRPAASMPTVSATANPDGSDRLPDTCANLYTDDMKRVLAQAGLEVNSAWTGARNLPAGTADTELLRLLPTDDRLECFWLDEFGGEDSALLTVLVESTETSTQAAMARLTELGLTRREEHGGVRYFAESRDASGELHGESHFFRDGLWFATRWYGPGQFGYTADMVKRVFG
jgi:hypothetical protein